MVLFKRQIMNIFRLFVCFYVNYVGICQAAVLRENIEIDDVIDLDPEYLKFSGHHSNEDNSRYYIRLSSGGDNYSDLPLFRHPHIDANSPLCYIERGIVVCEKGNHEDTHFYVDVNHTVAVAISNTNGTLKMKGIVNTHNSSIEVNQTALNGLPSNGFHVIRKRWTANLIQTRVRNRGNVVQKPRGSPYKTITEQPPAGTYCINILCVVDYSIYQKYLQSEKTPTKAIEKIRFYYAHVINGINMRYETITEKGFSIKVRLAGYFIAKSPTDLRFIDYRQMSRDPSYRVDSNHTLTELDSYLKSMSGTGSSALPRYNHAMFFLEYASNNLGGSVLGTSFVSGICSESKGTSLVVDLGGYTSAGIGTHELGHNLGIYYHDGEGSAQSAECNASRNYIMAPASFLIDGDNLRYSFTFSPCSISQIKKHIKNLVNANRNCLECNLNDRATYSELQMDKEVQGHLETLPGHVDDVHAQCVQLYGPGSFMCPPTSTDEMCYRMYCYDPKRGACAIISEQMAAPGTPCGKFKVCKMGQCVLDTANGKNVPDDCPYPDILSEEAHCEDAMPFMCSNEKFRQKCCSSCNKEFTAEESCKDTHIIINGMTCAQLVRSPIGRPACSGDFKVQNMCCQSCKVVSNNNVPADRGRVIASRPPQGVRCEDSTTITINRMSCADLIASNSAYCQGCQVQEVCCKSCTPYRAKYKFCQ